MAIYHAESNPALSNTVATGFMCLLKFKLSLNFTSSVAVAIFQVLMANMVASAYHTG